MSNFNYRISTFLGSAIIIVVGVLAGSFLIYQYHLETETSNTETAQWMTYRNEKYSYSMQYPSHWHIEKSSTNGDFFFLGDGKYPSGGYTEFSNYPFSSPEPYHPGGVPSDFSKIYLWVYKVSADTTYEQFSYAPETPSRQVTKEDVIIDGIPSLKKTTVVVKQIPHSTPVGINSINYYIKVDEKMFVLHYDGNPLPQYKKDAADKIISSFKFKK